MDEQQEPEMTVLTVAEAAALLRIGRGQAYDLVRQGVIPAVRLGRRIVVPRAALERWLAVSAGGGDQQPRPGR